MQHSSLPVLMLTEADLPVKDASRSKRQKKQQREAPAAAAYSAEPPKQPEGRAAAPAALPSTAEASISTCDGLASFRRSVSLLSFNPATSHSAIPILKLLPQRLSCSDL